MNARRRALGGAVLTILLAGTACAGKTVVLEPPTGGQPTTSYTNGDGGHPFPGDVSRNPTDPETARPSPAPEPSEPAPEQSGWWPPEASPTPSHTPSDDPAQPPSQKPEGESGSEREEPTEGEAPGTERFTFPEWEEHIYDSRNGPSPEKFRSRERFASCGDYASDAGAHVLSPDVAACLDDGKNGTGKESAIAVRTGKDGVHVWFVRVGPESSEYFVDRSQDGGTWAHATCDSEVSIGVLACEEPTELGGAQQKHRDPEEVPSPGPEQNHTPSGTPEESPTSSDDVANEEDSP